MSLFSALMIVCISASCSRPKPFSARPASSIFLVRGLLHNARNSASFLKNSGNLPNSNSKNCWADMGVPSGCQNVVQIMCWMVNSFPFASFTFALAFFLHSHGCCPQTEQGSFGHAHGLWPQIGHSCF